MKKLMMFIALVGFSTATLFAQTPTAAPAPTKPKMESAAKPMKPAEAKPAKSPEAKPAASAAPMKKDGTPDKRFKKNKHVKKDGTPDNRFKDNKTAPAPKK